MLFIRGRKGIAIKSYHSIFPISSNTSPESYKGHFLTVSQQLLLDCRLMKIYCSSLHHCYSSRTQIVIYGNYCPYRKCKQGHCYSNRTEIVMYANCCPYRKGRDTEWKVMLKTESHGSDETWAKEHLQPPPETGKDSPWEPSERKNTVLCLVSNT